jgi:signal transduction histidine kinase
MAQSYRIERETTAPYDILRGALQQIMVVAHTGPLVAAEPDFAKRVRLLTRAAATVGMGHAALLIYEPITEGLVPLAVVNGLAPTAVPFSGAQSGLTPLPAIASMRLDEGLAGAAATQREPQVVNHVAADPHWQPTLLAPDAAVLGITPHALLALPLVDGEALLGVLEIGQAVGGPAAGFDPRTQDLLRALAAQATLVLTIERREQDLQRERQRAVDAQEEERRRLARDLHDGPVQSVANAAMTLEYIDRLLEQRPAEARTEIRQLYTRLTRTMRELRGVLFDLRPLVLETDGLAVALPHLIGRLAAEDGPDIRFACDLPERLPAAVETAIYLVAREALTNVIKHAQATICWVDVSIVTTDAATTRREVQVGIRDNGLGFDSDEVLANYPRGESWGMLNMYERARLVTERFAIHSRPNQGTNVEMVVALA